MLQAPPYDLQVEQALLGQLLVFPEYFADLELTEYDFYNENLKIIFKNILEVKRSGKEVDLVSLKENLEKNKIFEKIGGITFLSSLTDYLDFSGNFQTYQEILKEKSRLRKLLTLTNILQKDIGEEKQSTEIVSELYKFLPKIEKEFGEKKEMAEIYEEAYEYVENIKNTELVGISYGKEFKFLDEFTGGIQPGNIIRIGGGSNVGKTWLLLNFLLEVVEKDGNVTFFSLENSSNFTLKNIFGLKKGVNSLPEAIKKNKTNFSEEGVYFFEKNNFFLDTESRKLEDIFRKTLKNKSKFIFIDYLQLVRVEGNSKNERLTEYAFKIQEFAQKNKITVFDLSQLSNEANRGGAEGQASTEFYGASELKASCDVGIHIFSDSDKMKLREQCLVAGDNRDYFKNFVKIKISKNRLGAGVGIVKNFFIDFSKGGKFLNGENNF
ncbi:hypothetical protein DLH72_01030 [Candidatus Gracilibacteria bacterium]|nr:MAG: hypothetical protein DLH72_01030 [Candidatus Gracilibacteria bacterium]